MPAARLAQAVRDAGHPLYRTLGFHDVGPTTLWWRPTDRAT
ncbi:MAG: hypothetical protein ACRDLC_09095 [Actinomycetota bacterium]